MDFFMTVADKRMDPDSTLRKIGTLINWQRLAAVVDATVVAESRAEGEADPVGDHVPGFPGMSPVPASPPVQTACGAVPIHGAASRGDENGHEDNGA